MKAEIQNLVTDLGRKNSEEFLKLAEERLGKVQISAEKDHIARQKEIDSLFGPMIKSLNNLEKQWAEVTLAMLEEINTPYVLFLCEWRKY